MTIAIDHTKVFIIRARRAGYSARCAVHGTARFLGRRARGSVEGRAFAFFSMPDGFGQPPGRAVVTGGGASFLIRT